jgi:hypothetical protein
MNRHYIQGFELNTRRLTELANTLTREQLLTRPGNVNPFIWILGHITMIRGTMIKLLGGESGITAEEQKLFGPRSIVLENDGYPQIQELLKLFSQRGAELCRLLETAEPSKMQEESPFKFAFGEKVVGDSINFLYWHEATHYGEMNYLYNMLTKK